MNENEKALAREVVKGMSDILGGNYRYGTSFAYQGFIIGIWREGIVHARYMYDDVIRFDVGTFFHTPAQLANRFQEFLDSNPHVL